MAPLLIRREREWEQERHHPPLVVIWGLLFQGWSYNVTDHDGNGEATKRAQQAIQQNGFTIVLQKDMVYESNTRISTGEGEGGGQERIVTGLEGGRLHRKIQATQWIRGQRKGWRSAPRSCQGHVNVDYKPSFITCQIRKKTSARTTFQLDIVMVMVSELQSELTLHWCS